MSQPPYACAQAIARLDLDCAPRRQRTARKRKTARSARCRAVVALQAQACEPRPVVASQRRAQPIPQVKWPLAIRPSLKVSTRARTPPNAVDINCYGWLATSPGPVHERSPYTPAHRQIVPGAATACADRPPAGSPAPNNSTDGTKNATIPALLRSRSPAVPPATCQAGCVASTICGLQDSARRPSRHAVRYSGYCMQII